MPSFFKKIRPHQIGLYVPLLIFAGLFLYFVVFRPAVGAAERSTLTAWNGSVYYTTLVLSPLLVSLKWFGIVLALAFVVRAAFFVVTSFRSKTDPALFFTRSYWREKMRSVLREFKAAVALCLPVLVSLFLIGFILGQVNTLHKGSLRDEALMRIDQAITGGYPFMLGSRALPEWFVESIVFSYGFLVTSIVVLSVYLLLKHRQLFRELVVAFSIGLVVMFPAWFFVPALSPHDRFIDNVYKLPVAPDIAQALEGYRPQPAVKDFLQGMRLEKETLHALPTATVPSGHVAWAAIFAYYIWRARRAFPIIVALPVLGLATFGTFFLAQHYFIDVPAGIAAAVLSIVFTRALLRNENNLYYAHSTP